MHEKTKIATIDGARYQVRRMTPAVGSYIWQRLMAATYKAQEGRKGEAAPDAAADVLTKKLTAEEKLRGLCAGAFMFLTFDDFEFVQRNCLRVLSREEGAAGFLPVAADDGRFAVQGLDDDPMLVTQLMVEAIAFNLESFLAERQAAAPVT